MKLKNIFNKSLITFTISLIFIIVGAFLIIFWRILYDQIMKSNLVLTPTSTAYGMWKQNPVPLTIDFYLHNWTNAELVHNSTVKPSFNQMGPYRFRETKEKVNITWNSNNTVTFKHLKKWYFDKENSVGALTDNVTTINPIAVSAAYATRNWNTLLKRGLSLGFNSLNIDIHVTKTVGELLFDGFEDPLLNMAKSMPFMASNIPAMDKFGWFYGRNGSEDYEGTFNMDTGYNGTLGRLYEWKYAKRTDYYRDKCSDIDGSAGEFFPQDLTKKSIVKLFSADLCRPMELEYQRDVHIHNIKGYKYSAGDKFLDNGTKFEENKCFCMGNCMPSGALNVSACRYGSPAFVSLPHFHNADPYYEDSIQGVKSNGSRHEFYMIFEPQTAVPLEVAARLQLNLLLQPINGVDLYTDVPTAYIPILWFEQLVKMPQNMAVYIKLLVNFKTICCSIGIIAIFTGLLLQICFIYKLCTTNLFERTYDANMQSYVLSEKTFTTELGNTK